MLFSTIVFNSVILCLAKPTISMPLFSQAIFSLTELSKQFHSGISPQLIEELLGLVNKQQNVISQGFGGFDQLTPTDFRLTRELILNAGYGYQNYTVITEDGYILSLHRILNKKYRENRKAPVLIQHGLLCASDLWLVNGIERGLPYALSNLGYDVWLGDQRGNYYSHHHTNLSTDSREFWNFTFEEAGYYDMPAFIDTILNETGEESLYYIGHSMGTTVFLVMTSLRPEYNSKIKASVLLAPIGPVPPISEVKSQSLKFILMHQDLIAASFFTLGIYELLPRTNLTIVSIRNFCGQSHPITQSICLDLVNGGDQGNINKSIFGEQLSRFPASTSSKNVYHLGQIYKTGFRQYDYGDELNQAEYGTPTPPLFPLEKITSPVALIYGANDQLMNEKSAERLASQLPRLIFNMKIPYPKFTHVDFVFGINAFEQVYKKVMDLFEQIESGQSDSSNKK